jgi:hypothetical protein
VAQVGLTPRVHRRAGSRARSVPIPQPPRRGTARAARLSSTSPASAQSAPPQSSATGQRRSIIDGVPRRTRMMKSPGSGGPQATHRRAARDPERAQTSSGGTSNCRAASRSASTARASSTDYTGVAHLEVEDWSGMTRSSWPPRPYGSPALPRPWPGFSLWTGASWPPR